MESMAGAVLPGGGRHIAWRENRREEKFFAEDGGKPVDVQGSLLR